MRPSSMFLSLGVVRDTVPLVIQHLRIQNEYIYDIEGYSLVLRI